MTDDLHRTIVVNARKMGKCQAIREMFAVQQERCVLRMRRGTCAASRSEDHLPRKWPLELAPQHLERLMSHGGFFGCEQCDDLAAFNAEDS